MNYRQFADTNLKVSEICLGPMRFSAKSPSDDEKSQAGKRALERALERGVNFIHSSYEYGTRWAVGEVLKNHPRRGELHHIIKVPVPDSDDNGKFDSTKFRLRIEEALRDLHTDCIDVLQHLQRARPNTDDLRIPNIPAVEEPMMEIFEQLKEEGKVGYLTTFPYSPEFAREAIKTKAFKGMVAYYNPIEMDMAEFFPLMEQQNQGFFCIRPFMSGLLTDKRVDRNGLEKDDRYNDPLWEAAYDRLALLNAQLGSEINSWTDFAIKFSLCHPIVTSLIVGLNTEEQVDGVLDAADGNYPDLKTFEKVLSIYRENGQVKSN
jgi:aryl-alcohol dehydrogenase (NADP+)